MEIVYLFTCVVCFIIGRFLLSPIRSKSACRISIRSIVVFTIAVIAICALQEEGGWIRGFASALAVDSVLAFSVIGFWLGGLGRSWNLRVKHDDTCLVRIIESGFFIYLAVVYESSSMVSFFTSIDFCKRFRSGGIIHLLSWTRNEKISNVFIQ